MQSFVIGPERGTGKKTLRSYIESKYPTTETVNILQGLVLSSKKIKHLETDVMYTIRI